MEKIFFKTGDKVICINNDYAVYRLELNKVYTVKEVHNEYLLLNESVYRQLTKRFMGYNDYILKERLNIINKIKERINDR